MENRETPEQLKPLLRGDKVLRVRRRRPRRRLRFTPDIPGVIRFLKQIATETPLVPLTFALRSARYTPHDESSQSPIRTNINGIKGVSWAICLRNLKTPGMSGAIRSLRRGLRLRTRNTLSPRSKGVSCSGVSWFSISHAPFFLI